METSDGEDFVPPTPQTKKKPKNSLFTKPVAKIPKRKKTSGASPDFKKFKNRTKQVTLFNYIVKNKKSEDTSQSSPTQTTSSNPNKIDIINNLDDAAFITDAVKNVSNNIGGLLVSNNTNQEDNDFALKTPAKRCLLKKFESSPVSETSIYKDSSLLNVKATATSNTSLKSLDSVIAGPVVSKAKELPVEITLDVENNIEIKNSASNSIDKNDINQSCSVSKASKVEINNLDLLSCDAKICLDVENLKLNSDDNSSNNVTKTNLRKVEDIQENLSSKENSVLPADESFTWMSDLDWKNDSFAENNSLAFTSQVDEEKSKHSVLFQVENVDKSNIPREIKLTLKPNHSYLKTCYLRGFWVDSLVNPGDKVHIINQFEKDVTVIDDQSGFLVINPDFLLSSTAIVSTLFCMRKAVLNHILPNWSSGNKLMMIGNLVHDIFQQSVNSSASTAEEINKILQSVLIKRENLLALSCQDTPFSEIEAKLKEYVPSITNWIKNHVALKGKKASGNLQVTCVEAIEDNVWCPKYGVKGKIDMTVKTFFQDRKITKLVPLELKTGRASFSAEHVGQVNLYTLMMDERTKEESEGLLLYLKDASNMKVISANHNSQRGLIQLRNELAFYTYKWFSSSSQSEDIEHCHLPSPINSKKMCQKCPYLLPCTVYQKAFPEHNLDPDHAMNSLISSSTSHLSSTHLEYFIHWSNLLLLESTSSAVSNAFWTENCISREKNGLCLSWMILDKCLSSKDFEEKYYVNNFIRSENSPVADDILCAGLRVGDYVAISDQDNPDLVAISMGYIFGINNTSVEIGLDRNLALTSHFNTCIFRIDKQISNSATSSIRNNLMFLMSEDSQAERLRKFIIEKQEPSFLSSLNKNVVLLGRPILKVLNKIQQRAILKALMAEDYFLIKGMPGTGKTSTIVALVRLFVKMGISIFLTSYTHSAIDNILLKLKEHIPFVRIGQDARIHTELKQFSFQSLTKNFRKVDEFKNFMQKQMVVATTCLGINHPIFKIQKFDVCIVDEASQINQIACLGPLFQAKKFILVGDDKQLPPLVINEKARRKGMEESLFQRLGNPKNCIELNIQYRMNKEIMRICNSVTYEGALQCGSENIGDAVLQLCKSDLNVIQPWILTALDCNLLQSVVFINTDEVIASHLESDQGQEINNFEANLVLSILKALLEFKVSSTNIGIISPYRRQVDLIKRKILELKASEVEVNTVDQYQGRDKDVIIISCVKSDELSKDKGKKRSILEDEKRLNVAVTRAKKKLLIIGCKKALVHYKPFEDVIKCLREDQILNLSNDSQY